jgi:8-amino-7-oxononanoate synthase
MNPEKYYLNYTWQRKKANKFRSLPSGRAGDCFLDCKTITHDFSSNDYLGLGTHPDLVAAACKSAQHYGIGSTGSRLLSGNRDIFTTLETRIAKDKNTESALIFSSGYQANVSVLATLLDKKILGTQAIVFFDKANHNSLYQGVALGGAHLVRYRHGSERHLMNRLEEYKGDPRPKFIVTETLFGMEGDIAPLDVILTLARAYRAFVYLDDAHATGISGPRGYGQSTSLMLENIPHAVMGTFSKALGCTGAYIACSKVTRDYLINHCGGFVYSTALSPIIIGAAAAAWEMIPSLEYKRTTLYKNADYLRKGLANKFRFCEAKTPIIPLIIGDEKMTLLAGESLKGAGIAVSVIRPPTVAEGTARLRISVTSEHTTENLNALIVGLSKL